ncbi:class 1 fructose-bisphosphatase [Bernardetia sp. ABR2-2B]|uniref:class 1 fructose-bisphosphatase n=1 Tax=Bernardetia sp. ABR2-2B TaxID=3127472 RepID=UPI0030CE952E
MSQKTTLRQFLKDNEANLPASLSELDHLLHSIARTATTVHNHVSRAAITDLYGTAGSSNVQGEEQQKLDVLANTLFITAFRESNLVCVVGSEEEEEIILTNNNDAEYVVAMDPLDGSSNIDVNVSIGTIFSVFKRKTARGTKPKVEDVLQKGTDQLIGGYVLYGTATALVFTTGNGVHIFTYDPKGGEFLLTHDNLDIPKDSKTYSCNEGGFVGFTEGVKKYIDFCKGKGDYKARYIGSLVADFHRNMLKGGIFIYPSTQKTPKGKLRLLYECNPLAFIAEQAGGKAYDGRVRIMDIEPDSLHQRTTYYVGSANMVDKALELIETNE